MNQFPPGKEKRAVDICNNVVVFLNGVCILKPFSFYFYAMFIFKGCGIVNQFFSFINKIN